MTNETMCVHKQSFCVVNPQDSRNEGPKIKQNQTKIKMPHSSKASRSPLEYLPFISWSLGLCYSGFPEKQFKETILPIMDI